MPPLIGYLVLFSFTLFIPSAIQPKPALMFKLTFQKQLILGFAMSLFIVLSVNYFSYDSIQKLNANAALVSHTQEVLGSSKEVLAQMLNAETGQRGFIATGQDRYLEPYEKAITVMAPTINKLRQLVNDNQAQVARV